MEISVEEPEGKETLPEDEDLTEEAVFSPWRCPAEMQRGDRSLLMSDGVFRAVTEAEIGAILRQYPEAEQAASVLENRVLAAQNPKQDNFTAVLISYD